jgi:osmotically-inducible protein OsmY
MKKLFTLPAFGAALMFFFDPENGKRRRHMAVDRTTSFFRKRGGRLARGVAAEAEGLKQKATHLREEPKPQPDDVTLTRKVETEIFREAEVPKGQINVNAEDGVVYLRGEAEPDMIEELEAKTRKVQGVKDVQNLLKAPS